MTSLLNGGTNGRPTGRPRFRTLSRLIQDQEGVVHAVREELRHAIPGSFGVVDQQERAHDSEESTVRAALLHEATRTLRMIETALGRVRVSRDPDTCVDCAGRITATRLKALPFAVRCRSCQEQWEAETSPPEAGAPSRL